MFYNLVHRLKVLEEDQAEAGLRSLRLVKTLRIPVSEDKKNNIISKRKNGSQSKSAGYVSYKIGVLTVVNIRIVIFYVITPYSLVGG
jgi:hypothetical protein